MAFFSSSCCSSSSFCFWSKTFFRLALALRPSSVSFERALQVDVAQLHVLGERRRPATKRPETLPSMTKRDM